MKATIPVGILTLAILSAGCADEPVPAAESEVARIQEHLGQVLRELRTSRPAGLTEAQAEAREQTIRWLEEYRAAGIFPHNHVRPGERVPVFVDPHGTPCAVGYLMLRSGEDALVEQIVETATLARVPELAGNERLTGWLDERGLTLREAARIQPMYEGREPDPIEPSSYAEETVALSIVTAAVTAFAELTEPEPRGFDWPGSLNVAAGLSHGTLLAIAAADGDAPTWQLVVNGVGALVGGVAAVRRFSGRDEGSREEDAAVIAPLVSSSGSKVAVGFTIRY